MKSSMFKNKVRFLVCLAILASLFLASPGGSAAAAYTTTRVSVDSNGVEGNDTSRRPSISADGRYVHS